MWSTLLPEVLSTHVRPHLPGTAALALALTCKAELALLRPDVLKGWEKVEGFSTRFKVPMGGVEYHGINPYTTEALPSIHHRPCTVAQLTQEMEETLFATLHQAHKDYNFSGRPPENPVPHTLPELQAWVKTSKYPYKLYPRPPCVPLVNQCIAEGNVALYRKLALPLYPPYVNVVGELVWTFAPTLLMHHAVGQGHRPDFTAFVSACFADRPADDIAASLESYDHRYQVQVRRDPGCKPALLDPRARFTIYPSGLQPRLISKSRLYTISHWPTTPGCTSNDGRVTPGGPQSTPASAQYRTASNRA